MSAVVDPMLVSRAADGDREALAAVLGAIKDDVYRLSVRMLWHPADAEDATQEILIRVLTRLDGFRVLCLDRAHRAAYILGEVFGLSSEEAASVLEIEPGAYRKRLSRARTRLQGFMRGHCGLLDEANACRCSRRVGTAIRQGRVDPDNLLFARGVRDGVRRMDRLYDAAAVFRGHPELRSPDRVVEVIQRAMRDS